MRTKPRIEINLTKVEEYAQVCDNEEEIALALGISYSTLQNRKRESEDFRNAIKRGKAKANIFVGGKLLGLVKEGNVAATIFWAKTRMGWRETQKVDLDVKRTDEQIAAGLSNDQLLEILRMQNDEHGDDKGGDSGISQESLSTVAG